MRKWFAITIVSVIYYTIAWYALSVFDAGLVATAVILYGVPSILLAYYSYAPAVVLITVSAIGIGLSMLLESVAHIYGLWYTLGAAETRLFGLVPAETMIAAMMQSIFFVLLYELFFDDGVYNRSSLRTRMGSFLLFTFAAMLLIMIQQYWLAGFFLTYSYVWMVLVICACVVAAMGVYRYYSITFFNRIRNFTLLAAIPSAMAMALAVINTHKVFANPEQYIFTLTIFEEMVPFEEVLLIFAVPFLIATIYELYLDDKS